MWQQYKKTFLVTQISIVIFCAIALYMTRGNLPGCLTLFVMMQMGSVVGAWYGVRLRTRMQHRAQALPLRR